jgi:hypothetical protein
MKPDRDIYIVSLPRGAQRVQRQVPVGSHGRHLRWKFVKLSRAQVNAALRDYLRQHRLFTGAKVFTETRRETARIASAYGIRPLWLAKGPR